MNRYNNFWIGLLVGATVPVIGFFLLEQIFHLLTSAGVVDEVTAGSSTRRERTLALLAIACNLPFVQFLKSRIYDRFVRGILIATFIFSAAWFIHYYSSLFAS